MNYPSIKISAFWQRILAQQRFGRVTLHLVCLTVHSGRRQWHWRGIAREIFPMSSRWN